MMSSENPNSRLEAFCDGVFAIAITLLIIEIKVPRLDEITDTQALWLALKHLAPAFFAFLLSFAIILITWVNHHATFKLLNKSSNPFIYANGFLLLTIVILPFPTSLLGETLLTDHPSPGVVLYSAANGLQAIGWFLMGRVAIKGGLAKSEHSLRSLKKNNQSALFALVIYTACLIFAFWFPLTITIVILLIWVAWLIYGLNIKQG